MSTIQAMPRSELDLIPALNDRYSARAFSQQPVTDGDLELLFEAARWAPSSHNEQPWRFLVVRRGGEGHADLLSTLTESNRRWADKAPVLVLNMVRNTFARDGRSNYHAWHDMGLAMGQFTAQATAMGIGLHILGGFHADRARSVFNVPPDLDLVSITALGYLGDANGLQDDLRERELRRSPRLPLAELVRHGRL